MGNCKVCEKHLNFWQGQSSPLKWSCRSCYDKYVNYENKRLLNTQQNTQQDWREKLT